jgi:hypothetical protein
MIDIYKICCIFNGCNVLAGFNYPLQKNGLYCSSHKLNGMIDVFNKKCKIHLCYTQISNDKYEGYCLRCFSYLFPDNPISKNHKTKECATVEFIKNSFNKHDWIYDKTIQDGCSKKRPDILLDLGYQLIILEIDENQHINYNSSCENKRLMELSQDVGHRPIVFIRFNPDYYIKNGVNIPSCWYINKKGICVIKNLNDWENRLSILENCISYWINPENKTEKTIEIIQLFYNQ